MPLDQRPAEYFARYHERCRTRDPDYVYELARMILTGPMIAGFRARSIDIENVPKTGAVILAPNHFSVFDHFLLAVYLPREVRFMAKSELFKGPLKFILSHGGSFPVRRKRHDQEAIDTALSILEREQVLAMYAEGKRSRTGKLGEPKRGLGRIVLQSGAPVVPVAIHGTSETKRMKHLQLPPKVTVQYGEQMTFPQIADPSFDLAHEVSCQVFKKIRFMYERLDREGRRAVIHEHGTVAAHS